MKLKQKFIE